MRKAVMYLLLALGIGLIVLFVGGALVGFAIGFVDDYNAAAPGTTTPAGMYFSSGLLILLLACVVLNVVFLRLGYAGYTLGRVPARQFWKVIPCLMLAMGGMALLYNVMYNPLTDTDEAMRGSYLWMKEHPVTTLLSMIVIEATGDLIIFGGIMREILEWKHRPYIVIPVFGLIMGVISAIFSHPLLIIPAAMIAQIEGYVYEYSRSVVLVLIGDAFYWVVMLALVGITFSGWWFLAACALIIPSIYFAMQAMEPYKPID